MPPSVRHRDRRSKWPLDPDRHRGTAAALRHAQDNNRLHKRLHQLAGFVQRMSNSLHYRTDVTTDAGGDQVAKVLEQVSRSAVIALVMMVTVRSVYKCLINGCGVGRRDGAGPHPTAT